jgi:hypothetical protein
MKFYFQKETSENYKKREQENVLLNNLKKKKNIKQSKEYLRKIKKRSYSREINVSKRMIVS